jgi:hypothetical protein
MMKTPHTTFTKILCALGPLALIPALHAVSPAPDGGYPGGNTAEGQAALFSLSTGGFNTAIGWVSLGNNMTGNSNTGIGAGTLALNTSSNNTAVGAAALLNNTSGSQNTANGTFALYKNTIADDNTADGYQALFNNTTGHENTANGAFALFGNTTGIDNTAIGFRALFNGGNGGGNTAIGASALYTGGGTGNTAMGLGALGGNTSGSFNTAIGDSAGNAATTGNGNVYIGAAIIGVAGESGHTYIRNIDSTSVSGGGTDTVTINLSTGLLGHLTSSRRYKENVKPIDKASETLYRLKPVSYYYKKEIDPTQSPAFGLIAEEVDEVSPNLVARNAKGEPERVHYEMVNAMLLNEFLKEHRTVQELKATVAQQEKQIDALASGLQKVSAEIRINNPALRVASTNP